MKPRLWEIHAASPRTGEIPAIPPDDEATDSPPDDHADPDHARAQDEDECCALLRPDPPRHPSARRRARPGGQER